MRGTREERAASIEATSVAGITAGHTDGAPPSRVNGRRWMRAARCRAVARKLWGDGLVVLGGPRMMDHPRRACMSRRASIQGVTLVSTFM